MNRLTALAILAGCAQQPGSDYTLTVTPELAPGHGPLDGLVATVTVDGEAPVETEADGVGGGRWVGAPALDGARLDLGWWPDDAVAQGTPKAHGTVPRVSVAEGEVEVRPWVADVARIATWDALGDGYAAVGAAGAVLPDGDLLVLGGTPPDSLGALGVSARATVLRASRDGVPALEEVGAMPPAYEGDDPRRTAHTVTPLDDGTFLVAGGRSAWIPVTAPLDTAFVLAPEGLTVVARSVLPERVGRSSHAAVPRADGVWLLGGYTGVGTLELTTVRWTPATNVWSKGPKLDAPGPIAFGHALLDDGTIVVCGGAAATVQSELVPRAGCAAIAPDGALLDLPPLPAPRQGLTLAAVGPRVVIAVGGTGAFLIGGTSEVPLGPASADAWRLDLDGDAWEPLPPLGRARAHAGALPLAPGMVLLVGGATAAAGVPPVGVGEPVDVPERYDDATRSFTEAEPVAAGAGAWPTLALHPAFGALVLAGAGGSGEAASGGRVWGWLTPGPPN